MNLSLFRNNIINLISLLVIIINIIIYIIKFLLCDKIFLSELTKKVWPNLWQRDNAVWQFWVVTEKLVNKILIKKQNKKTCQNVTAACRGILKKVEVINFLWHEKNENVRRSAAGESSRSIERYIRVFYLSIPI